MFLHNNDVLPMNSIPPPPYIHSVRNLLFLYNFLNTLFRWLLFYLMLLPLLGCMSICVFFENTSYFFAFYILLIKKYKKYNPSGVSSKCLATSYSHRDA